MPVKWVILDAARGKKEDISLKAMEHIDSGRNVVVITNDLTTSVVDAMGEVMPDHYWEKAVLAYEPSNRIPKGLHILQTPPEDHQIATERIKGSLAKYVQPGTLAKVKTIYGGDVRYEASTGIYRLNKADGFIVTTNRDA